MIRKYKTFRDDILRGAESMMKMTGYPTTNFMLRGKTHRLRRRTIAYVFFTQRLWKVMP